jgi:hypothetical protein
MRSRGNVDVADEVFADDYVRHDWRPSRAEPGPAGQKRIAADLRRAFPDLRFDVEMIIAEGDLVAARWTAEGTNSGSWGGQPANRPSSLVLWREYLQVPGWQGRRDLEPPRRLWADGATRGTDLRRR